MADSVGSTKFSGKYGPVVIDPVSGNAFYNGLRFPDDPTQTQKFVDGIDNNQPVNYTFDDPVSGKTFNRTYNTQEALAGRSDSSLQQYNTIVAKEDTKLSSQGAQTAETQLTQTAESPATSVTNPQESVTEQEDKNIEKNLNPTPGDEYGEAVNQSLQRQADSEFGQGKVTIGNVTITTDDSESAINPNPDTVKQVPLKNPLHYFAHYTYGISLHLLTPDQYNKMVKDQGTYVPENVLIASAGRYNPENFKRNTRFKEDFYFEDFNLTTLIAPNMHSRNTNAIEGSFTLIEPYGFTFVERLIMASQDLGMKNYLQNPYLLQIDFFAINDQGIIEESIDVELLPPKRIPVKITKLDAKVGPKGSEYKISIIPFSHSAYDVTTVSTPVNFEITATTVGEFFQSIEGTAEDVSALFNVDDNGREPTRTTTATTQNTNTLNRSNFAAGPITRPTSTAPDNAKPAVKNTSKTYTKVSSYGSAINAWQYLLKERYKTGTKDIYRFEIDPEIADSKFIDRLRNSPKDTPMAVDRQHQISMAKSNTFGTGADTYNSEKAIFQVNAGTTIEKLLDTIIGLSDYTLEQIAVPDSDPEYKSKQEKYAKEPFKFHKVVVKVELGEFDDRKKVWSRIITYHIKKYKMYNVASSLAPQGVYNSPVKAYNYIYTGINTDILDFNIEFNTLYFNAITALRDNLADTTTLGAAANEEQYYQNFPDYKGDGGTIKLGVNTVQPLIMKPQVANPRAQAAGGPVTAKEIAARDLIDSFMVANKADMLNVKLKILGDPDYIKQDDIFYGPEYSQTGVGVSGDSRLLPNGSLHMDNQEVYVQLLYKTPIDIDETNSKMNFDKEYIMSVFSGLYKIIQIKNIFSMGMFTQELDLVRLPRQLKFDYVNSQESTANNAERAAFPGKLGISQDTSKGPDFSVPAAGDKTTEIDDTITKTGQEQTDNTSSEEKLTTTEQEDLIDVNSTAPTEAISNNTTPQQTGPAESPPPPIS